MRRPSLSTTPTRRPKWAKDPIRYNAIINSAITRSGRPGEDFGVDNFTYCPGKVSAWQFPDHLSADLLPEELREAAENWVLAGAAVDTAIARIEALSGEAEKRAWPALTHEHLIASRREGENEAASDEAAVDGASSASGGEEELDLMALDSNISTISTPATGFSQPQPQPPPKLNTAVPSIKDSTQLPASITSKPGMETPPETPITRSGSESGACSPALHSPTAAYTAPTTPDAVKLSAQLSPLSLASSQQPLTSPTTITSSSSSTAPRIDKVAWHNYINALAASLRDLQTAAVPRLRGYEREVQRCLVSLRSDPPEGLSWEVAGTVVAFAEWWRRDAKQMVQERVASVGKLEVARLEDVVGAP